MKDTLPTNQSQAKDVTLLWDEKNSTEPEKNCSNNNVSEATDITKNTKPELIPIECLNTIQTKICKICKKQKLILDFYKHKNLYHGKCKRCELELHKIWATNNKLHLQKYARNRYHTNAKHREMIRISGYKYRNNPKNKSIIKSKATIKARNYRKNARIRILQNLRRRLLFVLNGERKSNNTLNLIGCSHEQLIKHIESKFQIGMSWDNYGIRGWHIDHKKPCSLFDLSNSEEQKMCFHYTNLQPMWAEDNLKKWSHYLPI